MGYPIITQLALNEFTDDLMRVKSEPSDGKAAKEVSLGADGKPIYPTESGLVPHYTGHIPGMHTLYVKREPSLILRHFNKMKKDLLYCWNSSKIQYQNYRKRQNRYP